MTSSAATQVRPIHSRMTWPGKPGFIDSCRLLRLLLFAEHQRVDSFWRGIFLLGASHSTAPAAPPNQWATLSMLPHSYVLHLLLLCLIRILPLLKPSTGYFYLFFIYIPVYMHVYKPLHISSYMAVITGHSLCSATLANRES